MYIVIGVLSIAILIFICILVNYKRQIKDICRQLRFLQEHESNMLITKEMQWGHIGELTELLNEMLKERKKERTAYRKKEQMIADIYTNLSHDIRTPLTSLDGYFQDVYKRQEYISICDELGLSALVEAHDECEVRMALNAGARMIGVNNRNLKGFSVDTGNSGRFRRMIPRDVLFVSESGVSSAEDVYKRQL